MSDYPSLHLLIGGEKLSLDGRKSDDVLNPATGEVIGAVPHATAEDLDVALDNSARGFAGWRATPAVERAAILTKAAGLLRERAGAIAEVMTREQGKPVGEAKGETIYGAMLLEFYAGECQRISGRSMDRPEGKRAEVHYEPVGPIAAFAPWNFPSLNIARKVGGAIAAGCSVIVKPSEETPASALATVQCLLDAGLPGDVCQVVFGVPDDVSRHLFGSPIIRKVSFTGSTAVGKHLAKLAAEDLKRTTMELGGHGPVLVFGDANIDRTLDVMAANAFRNAGQVCVSPTRFIVEESVFDEFRAGFVERVQALKVGNGLEDGVQMGPMANSRGPDQMERMVADAVEHGAKLEMGGGRIGNQGYFYAPTVLTGVPTDAEIMNEEPFGPVAILNRYAGETEMVAEANRLPYGLAAYAWSEDSARQERVISQIEAGMVAVNAGGVSAVDMPFGGVKWSGHGHEDGREGIMACMVAKSVHVG